jgi:hypothetical protein
VNRVVLTKHVCGGKSARVKNSELFCNERYIFSDQCPLSFSKIPDCWIPGKEFPNDWRPVKEKTY